MLGFKPANSFIVSPPNLSFIKPISFPPLLIIFQYFRNFSSFPHMLIEIVSFNMLLKPPVSI